MCHGYRIGEREALYEFVEEREGETPEEIAEPEADPEESEREPLTPTADD